MGSHRQRTLRTVLCVGLASLTATEWSLCGDTGASAGDADAAPENGTGSPWDASFDGGWTDTGVDAGADPVDAPFRADASMAPDVPCAVVLDDPPPTVAEPTLLPPMTSPSGTATTGLATVGVRKPSAPRWPLLGLNADVGLSGPFPDLGLLLAARPVPWFRLQAGGGYNGFAVGVRAGITVTSPVALPLSLTCEGGHYFEGDANKLVDWVSNAGDVSSLRRLSYDYLNVLGGFEVNGRHLSFYLRGGVTWMRTTIRNFEQSVREVARIDVQAADPRVTYRGPTLKLGTTYFF